MPSAIFNALPGIEVPVGAISARLAKMWDDTAAQGGPAPVELKATQLNFVLHLGFGTTVEDAREQFQTLLLFARRYPCRVVVLCPLPSDDTAAEMCAKIYGECFLGKSKEDTRCVEFVALSYPRSARGFLENQVSVCLSTDLPLYYWAHRFVALANLADYHYLLSRSKRVLIDSASAPADLPGYAWPRPEAVRDLAYARLLHVRQEIGQFLSGCAPAALVAGLRAVRIACRPEFTAEGRVLLAWTRERLLQCGAPAALPCAAEVWPDPAQHSLELAFDYGDARHFWWRTDLVSCSAEFEADFGAGRTVLPTTVCLLTPEDALAEAMFY